MEYLSQTKTLVVTDVQRKSSQFRMFKHKHYTGKTKSLCGKNLYKHIFTFKVGRAETVTLVICSKTITILRKMTLYSTKYVKAYHFSGINRRLFYAYRHYVTALNL